jgi:uncharacterized membrane protein YdjX (TVP38/TMEM64 family)
MGMRRRLPLLLVAIVATAFLLGFVVRGRIAIEFTPRSILDFVSSLGWKGPVIFLALVTFRSFLLLPSAVILPVGGLCFGAGLGTGLGAAGIAISACLKFSLARWLGRDWARSQIGPRLTILEQRVAAAGPWVVGLVTAHPMGPMTPFHWAAGLSSIPVLAFLVAVGLGGSVRAGAYSLLGSALLDLGSPRFLVASALLAAIALLPLAHPEIRTRILGRWRSRG